MCDIRGNDRGLVTVKRPKGFVGESDGSTCCRLLGGRGGVDEAGESQRSNTRLRGFLELEEVAMRR